MRTGFFVLAALALLGIAAGCDEPRDERIVVQSLPFVTPDGRVVVYRRTFVRHHYIRAPRKPQRSR